MPSRSCESDHFCKRTNGNPSYRQRFRAKRNKIVEEFQNAHQSIIYYRTDERESLYQAWNRGIEEASGNISQMLTLMTDTTSECLERLVNKLEEQPDCDVAYGNLYKSAVANETFDDNDKSKPCYSQKFTTLDLYCFMIS